MICKEWQRHIKCSILQLTECSRSKLTCYSASEESESAPLSLHTVGCPFQPSVSRVLSLRLTRYGASGESIPLSSNGINPLTDFIFSHSS